MYSTKVDNLKKVGNINDKVSMKGRRGYSRNESGRSNQVLVKGENHAIG